MPSAAEWRDVTGFEGRYQVSSDGRVRNSKGHILTPTNKSDRYNCVRLYSGGRKDYVDMLIHRLVAEAFLERPDGDYEVNHIDGNRYNNDVSNLEWVTHRENMRHAVLHRLVDPHKAMEAHRKPVTCSNGITYPSVRAAADALGVLESCISACLSGRYKTTGGYSFRLAEVE